MRRCLQTGLMVWLTTVIHSSAVSVWDDYEPDNIGTRPSKASLVRPSTSLTNARVLVVGGSTNIAGTGKALRLLDDDYEPDGMDNLLEYAPGGNPASNDAPGLLPVSSIATEAGTNWLVYIYKRRTDAAERGLNYQVLSGNSLVDGSVTNTVPASGVSLPSNGFETATHRISTAGEDRQFMGLEVQYSD